MEAMMTGAECSHPYLKKLAPDSSVCLECGAVIRANIGKVYDDSPLVMPPVIYLMTEDYWKVKNPWPLMPVKIAQKYGWYGSVLYGREYLVMPVFAKGQGPVFYSARCLEPGCPRKYKYQTPENRKRVMWRSGGKGSHVLVGEGIADAAWLSEIGPAAALLGSNGTFDERVIMVLDGDVKGIEGAFKIVQEMRKKGIPDTMTVILPPGKDPTDLPIYKLRKIIEEQTGVTL